jgi:hypothetical protein
MAKVGIIVLADIETHADMGRVANALETVKEFQVLSNPQHRLHRQFAVVRPSIAGACRFCAAAFGVKEEVQQSGIPLLGEYEGHPSLRKLVDQGYQIITF